MIRFVDLTAFYWCDEHDSNQPVCAFVDTITDRFMMANGSHVFSDDDNIDDMEDASKRERCRRLVPDGFWERKAVTQRPDGEMAVESGEEEA